MRGWQRYFLGALGLMGSAILAGCWSGRPHDVEPQPIVLDFNFPLWQDEESIVLLDGSRPNPAYRAHLFGVMERSILNEIDFDGRFRPVVDSARETPSYKLRVDVNAMRQNASILWLDAFIKNDSGRANRANVSIVFDASIALIHIDGDREISVARVGESGESSAVTVIALGTSNAAGKGGVDHGTVYERFMREAVENATRRGLIKMRSAVDKHLIFTHGLQP